MAEKGAIIMRVGIDQSRCQHEAGAIDFLMRWAGVTDYRYLIAFDPDVGDNPGTAAAVDDVSASDYKVKHRGLLIVGRVALSFSLFQFARNKITAA
jgi:hypothetical protein|tara:strand:+ start:79 stop:366 length:288 start_codon:yes stop_codon:yes gene_type:complete